MLESINRTYDNLSNRPEKKDLESAYNHLCQEQYFTGKLHRMYPFDRWKTCRTIRHPLNLMKVRSYVHTHEILYTHTRTRTRANMFTWQVRTDRQTWSCSLCHPNYWHVDMAKVNTGRIKKWHFGNCRKHFVSKTHCEKVIATIGTTTTLEDAAKQTNAEHVYKDELTSTIQNDVIV